ncbi:phage holin family protein [Agathobaculum sp. NTUH-O15-33]|uniref:phage holin family protein n=1 Tax=Agathobaculum sp. NTUH-O15-33 TaxID=3079302 RepID=UPI002958B801|nr:phage holin family protein [Agathobaculum sp. NTUH-O15-33]WNX85807.1 phage holin family protein [Agathobaculum sp. NTUH-O15-33]
MEHINTVKAAVASALAVLTALWGWFGWLVVLFVCCMAADYLTGSAAAIRRGEWSSQVARDGIWHKTGSILVVLVAGAADLLIGTILDHLPGIALPFQYSVLICPIVVIWYVLTELGSILENAVALGAPAPAWLAKILAMTKDAVDKAGGDETNENH